MAREQDEALLGSGQLDDLRGDALGLRGLGRSDAGMALVDVGQGDGLAGSVQDCLREAPNVGAVIDIGWDHMQGEQMAERGDGQMQLASALWQSLSGLA